MRYFKKCSLVLALALLAGCAENSSVRSTNWSSSTSPPIASQIPGGGVEGYYWYDTGSPHLAAKTESTSPTTLPPGPSDNAGPR